MQITFSEDFNVVVARLELDDAPSSLEVLGLLPERILKFLNLEIKEPDLAVFLSAESSALFKFSFEVVPEAGLVFAVGGKVDELLDIEEGLLKRGGGSELMLPIDARETKGWVPVAETGVASITFKLGVSGPFSDKEESAREI
jgi:hypothetical protein